jgi:hypothetical protein
MINIIKYETLKGIIVYNITRGRKESYIILLLLLLLFLFILSGVGLSPLGTAATFGLLYQPQTIDDGDCGVIVGIKTGKGSRSTRRKPAPVPLYPPQIPHDQTRAGTRAAGVGS